MSGDILHKLQERIKELTALHSTARLMQIDSLSPDDMLSQIALLIPPAWQYPEITSARIKFGGWEALTPGFGESHWKQRSNFTVKDSGSGSIEVFYLEERPQSDEGPFLKEERDLIESLAEMLRTYFQHLQSDKELEQARSNLEVQVIARTAELRRTNIALQNQIAEYKIAQERIEAYQHQLQQLASQLSLTEARERRAIASDLHDHIGQALAFIKMNISQFRGNAIFCGFESNIDRMMSLLDQTIRYTRDLTFEISPPVLYELGLSAALEWLTEKMREKTGVKIGIAKQNSIGRISDDIQITLFKAAQELIANAVKHSGAGKITIGSAVQNGIARVWVSDNGRGFDAANLTISPAERDKFGLFSIAERLKYLGGDMKIDSIPGKGSTVTLSIPLETNK
jgi:signal transduction histidine kinase